MDRPKEGDELLSQEQQKLYRSGVGMLLYLVKHSRPDMAYKMMLRCIKYVESTCTLGLRMEPDQFGREII